MSQAQISFPSGVAMSFETAGRIAAIAVAPYRDIPGGSEGQVFAARLEHLARQVRGQELLGPDAVEALLVSCGGFLQATCTEPVPILVTARTVTEEDAPAHEVSEDEDINEQGL
jgi:hypothetical protein